MNCLLVTSIGHNDIVSTFSISPDGKWVATGSPDTTIILWELDCRRVAHQWIAHSGEITCLAFSPYNEKLASGGRDHQLKVWNFSKESVERLARLEGHTKPLSSCAWSPDGTLIASSGSLDRTIRVWDAQTFQLRYVLEYGPSTSHATNLTVFSPNSRWLATDNGGPLCYIWHPKTGAPHTTLRGHETQIRIAVFDSESRRIATASGVGRGSHNIRIWDVETGAELLVFRRHPTWIRDVSFSRDGRMVLSAADHRAPIIWDAATGVVLQTLEGHEKIVRRARFSPDGKYAVSASYDETVRLWRTSDGSCRAIFAEHSGRATYASFSPDGETLVSAGHDGAIYVRRMSDLGYPVG